MRKNAKSEAKYERILKSLMHREPDRVPITDFFWKGFIDKWKRGKKTEEDIYLYYDLDLIVQFPNIEPRIQRMEVVESGVDFTVLKTGFGYTIKTKIGVPMPQYIEPMVKSAAEYSKVRFDDPADHRRFSDIRDDLINLGEGTDPAEPFMESIQKYKDEICIFGGALDPYEYLMRLRGQEELLVDLALHKREIGDFIPVVSDFIVENCVRQIRFSGVKGIYLGGDVAYDRGMVFSPETWRAIFKPHLIRICDAIHAEGALIIYHGCGNMKAILPDLIDCGVDCINPLQVSAGLDVVELKKEFGNTLSFMGNISVRDVLEGGTRDQVRREILRKLNAAKNGGYIAMSDHSVSSNVIIENYEYMVHLVREYGTYPLQLGEFDEIIAS